MVGRAGRGERLGRAIIQTFTPQNDVIQCAAEQDYDRFYANEIRMREARGMPPYRELYVFTVSGTDEGAVLRSCMRLADGLRAWQKEPELQNAALQILGPAAAPVLHKVEFRLGAGASWVQVIAPNGRNVVASEMRPQSVQAYEIPKGSRFTIGNAGVVSLTIDGEVYPLDGVVRNGIARFTIE